MSRQEAVTVIRLDTSQVPAGAAQVQSAFGAMARTGDASAGQIRAAMRSLPAQFTDVATQLAGGQNPLLILLQQGGQVRDQFGSIGAALRGVGSLITPATLGVAGVAALTAVLAAGALEAGKLQRTLEISGNAAGLTADRYAELAKHVAASSRVTEGGAKDIALALAGTGAVSARVLDDMAVAVARVATATGRTGEEVAKDFAGMASGVANWAAEHNKAWNFISAEQYLYIKRLEEQGKAEEAMIFVSKQLTGQLEVQTTNLGYLEAAWLGVKNMASGAWQAMLGLGKADTLAQQLAAARGELGKIEQRIADAKASDVKVFGLGQMEREREELRQRIANITELQRMEGRAADASSARAAAEQAKIKALREAKSGGKNDLGDHNPYGLFMGPEYVSAAEDFRRSELAATDATNLELRHRIGAENTKREAEEQKAAARRAVAQADLLQLLVDQNATANVDLIADDQQRALAQVDLERAMIQRRIDALIESGPARAAAEALADQQAAAQRQAVDMRFAKSTALVTREETRKALADAFRDTKNPIKAFGDAIGNIVFQRVSTALADALLTAAFGPGGGFSGGALGSLLSALGGGGGEAGLLPGGVGAVPYAAGGVVERPTLFKFASGGALRNGLMGEAGPEAILPLKRGAGGQLGVRVVGAAAAPISIEQHLTFGSNVSRNEMYAYGQAIKAQTLAAVADAQRRRYAGGAS